METSFVGQIQIYVWLHCEGWAILSKLCLLLSFTSGCVSSYSPYRTLMYNDRKTEQQMVKQQIIEGAPTVTVCYPFVWGEPNAVLWILGDSICHLPSPAVRMQRNAGRCSCTTSGKLCFLLQSNPCARCTTVELVAVSFALSCGLKALKMDLADPSSSSPSPPPICLHTPLPQVLYLPFHGALDFLPSRKQR